MQRARGVKVVAASDLFYPDLSARAPLRLARGAAAAGAPAVAARARSAGVFQQGLLAWLRGDAAGARAMRDAVVGIEAVTAQPNLRAFWWTVGALLDAIVGEGARAGLRRQAARGAHRPADPPRGRGLDQGRRPAAARGALLRRDQRAGDPGGARSAAGVPAARSSFRRPRRCRPTWSASSRCCAPGASRSPRPRTPGSSSRRGGPRTCRG